jgi:hypothetical protein
MRVRSTSYVGTRRTDQTCWKQMRASPWVCRVCGKNETTLSATTQVVVEVALHASPSNKLGIHQSNGSILLEKMRPLSRATIKGHGGSRFIEGLSGAEGSVGTRSQ